MKKWYVKRILKVPGTTPDYVLTLEVGTVQLFSYTLLCHLKYMGRVLLHHGNERLTNGLARRMIEQNVGWYADWMRLEQLYGVILNVNNGMAEYLESVYELIERMCEQRLNIMIERGRNTSSHGFFNLLQYVNGNSYINGTLGANQVSIILKARSGMLELNDRVYRNDRERMCSMCNLRMNENVYHFLGVCPILGDIRISFFGERVMSSERCINVLNGENWERLALYLQRASLYRRELMREFNF